MTAKKDLKRRIRERMRRTNETYVVARRAVLAEAKPTAATPTTPVPFTAPSLREAAGVVPELATVEPGRIEVVEMEDFSALATELGLKCSVSVTLALAKHVPARVALERFREILLGTTEDPAFEVMRAVALRGEKLTSLRAPNYMFDDMKRFVARVRVGVGGVSSGGTMLAVQIGGVMMVAHLGFGIVTPARAPRVVLTTAEAAGFWIEAIAVRRSAP